MFPATSSEVKYQTSQKMGIMIKNKKTQLLE
jgi:hypothetical protein